MPQHWVFAYGSNMHRVDLLRWHREHRRPAPVIDRAERAVLPDHALVFDYHSRARGGGAANVAPCTGAHVIGLALRLCSVTLESLDLKEGRPHNYERHERVLHLGEERDTLTAWVYQVVPARRSDTFVPPRRSYLSLLVEAAQSYGFGQAYVAQLQSIATQADDVNSK